MDCSSDFGMEKGILDDRTSRSIIPFNNVRNGASHSNSGKLLVRDSQLGFEIIEDLVNIHFSRD